jgi:hypothetical protein
MAAPTNWKHTLHQRLEASQLFFQSCDPRFVLGNASVSLATSWACGDFHECRLHGRSLRSCASFSEFG